MVDDLSRELLERVANHNGNWTRGQLRDELVALNPSHARLVSVAIVALEAAGLIESRHNAACGETRCWITTAGRQELGE